MTEDDVFTERARPAQLINCDGLRFIERDVVEHVGRIIQRRCVVSLERNGQLASRACIDCHAVRECNINRTCQRHLHQHNHQSITLIDPLKHSTHLLMMRHSNQLSPTVFNYRYFENYSKGGLQERC